MIKLIASDLDGTLLPPSKILPEETFDIIGKLHSRGITFAPASGRQLPNLKKLFAPVLDKIAIIAENGGLVWYGGEVIYSDPTPSESVAYALDIIRKEQGLYPVLSCTDCAYYSDDNEKFVKTLLASYSSAKRVDNLNEVLKDNTVLKISVWDEIPPCAEHGGAILPPKIKGLRTMVSGYDWLDVSVTGSSKGKALEALMEKLGVDKSECEAYGDHMNDLEMLQTCGNPFVTANAFHALKAIIRNEIPSNAEFGVIQKLKEHL
ncbi:MAG: HAD family phosphatase [Clostridia bacterium]|nr:HAD family phosphatase [Clostridia bacterium]